MTRSYVKPEPGTQTLKDLPPSTPDEIRRMAAQAGLKLPPPLMDELIKSYPAFEAMVRRLPRARLKFDEPANHCVAIERIERLEK
ncbi:MAG TPA: hypothetical protein VNM70_17855 [Burkholderiales bacterium]|nr:hypothetical protein [Burkholderiales bacterium]